MAQALPPPKLLKLHEGNIAENWRKFKKTWSCYEIAAGFRGKGYRIRASALLSVIGEEGVELHGTLEFDNDGDSMKIEEYCIPRANVIYETYRFFSRDQEEGKTITALKALKELWR